MALGAGELEFVGADLGDLFSAWAFFASFFPSFFASFLALALEMEGDGLSPSIAIVGVVEAVVLAAGDTSDGINDAAETEGSALLGGLNVVRLCR